MIERPLILGPDAVKALSADTPEPIVLWIRERFSTRLDGDQIKIRYPVDGPAGVPRFVPAADVPAKYRTERYFTRAARHMPRWASRHSIRVNPGSAEVGQVVPPEAAVHGVAAENTSTPQGG